MMIVSYDKGKMASEIYAFNSRLSFTPEGNSLSSYEPKSYYRQLCSELDPRSICSSDNSDAESNEGDKYLVDSTEFSKLDSRETTDDPASTGSEGASSNADSNKFPNTDDEFSLTKTTSNVVQELEARHSKKDKNCYNENYYRKLTNGDPTKHSILVCSDDSSESDMEDRYDMLTEFDHSPVTDFRRRNRGLIIKLPEEDDSINFLNDVKHGNDFDNLKIYSSNSSVLNNIKKEISNDAKRDNGDLSEFWDNVFSDLEMKRLSHLLGIDNHPSNLVHSDDITNPGLKANWVNVAYDDFFDSSFKQDSSPFIKDKNTLWSESQTDAFNFSDFSQQTQIPKTYNFPLPKTKDQVDFCPVEAEIDFCVAEAEIDFSAIGQVDFSGFGDQADLSVVEDRAGFSAMEDQASFSATEDRADFSAKEDRAGFSAKEDRAGFSAKEDRAGFSAKEDRAGFSATEDRAGFFAMEDRCWQINFDHCYIKHTCMIKKELPEQSDSSEDDGEAALSPNGENIETISNGKKAYAKIKPKSERIVRPIRKPSRYSQRENMPPVKYDYNSKQENKRTLVTMLKQTRQNQKGPKSVQTRRGRKPANATTYPPYCSHANSDVDEPVLKRSMHNNMERLRRNQQRVSLYYLRDVIPNLKGNLKISKVKIISTACEFIHQLIEKDKNNSFEYSKYKNVQRLLRKQRKSLLKQYRRSKMYHL